MAAATSKPGYRFCPQKDGSCVLKYQGEPGKRYYIGKYPSREEAEAEVRRLEQGEEL